MFADVAREQNGVDGTGVTLGVISDSVNQYNGGLSDSESTGNLPTSPPVNVLSDGSAGSTDEGRAMLEDIYDVAPGAHLAFARLDFLGMDDAILNHESANGTNRSATRG